MRGDFLNLRDLAAPPAAHPARLVAHRRLGVAVLIAAGFGLGFALGGQTLAVDAPRPAPIMTAAEAALAKPAALVARPIEGPVRGLDAYGSGEFGAPRDGGRRTHGGVDLVAAPGAPVRAPITGVVTRIGTVYAGPDDLRYVEIANAITGVKARVLYVGATVKPGGAVAAGDLIGRAQSLAQRYPGGITNHVHLEVLVGSGARFNPLAILPALPGIAGSPTA